MHPRDHPQALGLAALDRVLGPRVVGRTRLVRPGRGRAAVVRQVGRDHHEPHQRRPGRVVDVVLLAVAAADAELVRQAAVVVLVVAVTGVALVVAGEHLERVGAADPGLDVAAPARLGAAGDVGEVADAEHHRRPAGLHRVEHGAGGGVGLAEVPGRHRRRRWASRPQPPDSPTVPAPWPPAPPAPARERPLPAAGAAAAPDGVRSAPARSRCTRPGHRLAGGGVAGAEPDGDAGAVAAAVTPAPGSPDSGGSVLAFASASKSTACGRSTPSRSPHLRGPDRAPVHQPGALSTTPLGLAVPLLVAADVPGDRLGVPGRGHCAARRRSRSHRSRGRCPTPLPVPAARSPCPSCPTRRG